MKPFIFLFLLALVSCSMEESPVPVASTDTCNIGYLEIRPNNVSFVKTTNADTIWVKYEHPQYGWISSYWTDPINWDCIGFTRDITKGLVIWTRNDTCTLIIPGKDE